MSQARWRGCQALPRRAPTAIRRIVNIATAAFVLLALAGAVPAHASAAHGAIHRIAGVQLRSGVTAFHLQRVRVRAVIGAHVTLASGRRIALRLRRLRAGSHAGVVRLHLPRSARHGRPVLTVRTDRRAPVAPRRLAATAGDGRVRLHWSRARDKHLRGYRILHKGKRVATTRSATTKTITGLANGTPYTVQVVAVDTAGNVSPASEPVSATPGPAPITASAPAPVEAPTRDPSKADPAPVVPNGEVPGPAPAPVVCDRFAATGGSDGAAGTSAAPFATAQHLFDALTPGQTGCLRNGTYHEFELRARHSGTPAAPIVLASAPGERAKIVVDADVYLPAGITDVSFRDLTVTNNPSAGVTQAVMIQDFSDRSVWEGDDISANSVAHCMELGYAGHQTAHDTMIRRNRFHDCGDPAKGNQEHSIYFSQTVGATVTENVFWHAAAYTIHLYPSADRTTVTHNVIVGSGYAGVIFASDQDPGTGRMSDDNTVAYNIITGGSRFGLEVFWGASGQGTGNGAHDNCIAGNAAGAMAPMTGVAVSATATAPVTFVDAGAHDYRLAPGDPCLAVVGFDTAALLASAS